jgi:hypothetical protein
MKLGMNAACLACMALAAPAVRADVISSLYSTGVDDNRIALAAGAVDTHWTLVGPQAAVYGTPVLKSDATKPDAWLPDLPTAGWINPCAPSGSDLAPGNYTYRTTFDLTCFDKLSAELQVRFASDNHLCGVFLNGVELGLGWTGYDNLSPLGTIRQTEVTRMDGSKATYDGLFVDGVNTLDFVVENYGDPSFFSPTGVMIDLQGTANLVCPVPEPGSVGLMGAAAGAAVWFRRRRRAA